MLRLLGGAVLVLVSAGLLVLPAWCRACRLPYCAVSCGSGGVRIGASVRCPEVRVAWPVLWCRGVPYGAVGWARRNTPVFPWQERAGLWVPCGEPLAHCVFWGGVRRK